ncbi:DUF5065 family protein [Bacillus sp. DX4.1]|uniref:DUF5065 family protein n=1 Tax=Bacillus sp. DX4.1 TaxID=3055867 RepID=UPI0025A1422A|nr:DUF5065 family protein [Bacillus sp. DX4.1]MDM5187551.1 DUF5065 family protein [Bacillus sp. DX4.1]
MMKLGKITLIGALTFGSFTTIGMIKPTTQAAAASLNGVSVNTTRTNFTYPNPITAKIKNDDDFETRVHIQPEKLVNGKWKNDGNLDTKTFKGWYALPEEYFGISINTDGTNGGVHGKGTYRLKVEVFHTNGDYLGSFFTNTFYVK